MVADRAHLKTSNNGSAIWACTGLPCCLAGRMYKPIITAWQCAALAVALAATIAFACAILQPAHAQTPLPSPCPAMPAPTHFALPHTSAAIAANQPVLVVAFGSSSTRGWMASGIGHAYPAILQRLLADARPFAAFAVVNRGVGGQGAAEELNRLDQDVLALHPQLVIWQTGANDALRGDTPDRFRATVTQGVARMQAAGADVVLMDNQHSPRLDASPLAPRMNRALADIAAGTAVNLFSRAALMQAWDDAGAKNATFIAHDGLHLNDLGYACTAAALARDIASALPTHTTHPYPRP